MSALTTLIRIVNDEGKVTRRCDARCHQADPLKPSHCCCAGLLKGCALGGRSALDVKPEFLAFVRETIPLNPGEHIQLRIGA